MVDVPGLFLTSGASASLAPPPQDDVHQAGDGGGQRLRVRGVGGRAHRHQRPRGGQQAQSEGTEGGREGGTGGAKVEGSVGMNGLCSPVGGAEERRHVRRQDPRRGREGRHRSDPDRRSGEQLQLHF